MATPMIDFRAIRTHHGSQHAGFEELVHQFAALESQGGVPFHRKGAGLDARLNVIESSPMALKLDGRPSISSSLVAGEAGRFERLL